MEQHGAITKGECRDMIRKTADVHVDRLDFRSAGGKRRTASGKKRLGSFEYEERPGYLYVACRALTADVPNLNYDMFPSEELETAYETFRGAYFFLNHDQNPDHARGAVIDAVWHPADEEGNDDENGWVEILIEIDEQRCPKLCELLKSGEIDTFSMGCSCKNSTCSCCGNVAEYPYEYCEHVQQKGREFQGRLAYEICNGVEFIEESAVFDPADVNAQTIAKSAKVAGRQLMYDDDLVVIRDGDGDRKFRGTWGEATQNGYRYDDFHDYDSVSGVYWCSTAGYEDWSMEVVAAKMRDDDFECRAPSVYGREYHAKVDVDGEEMELVVSYLAYDGSYDWVLWGEDGSIMPYDSSGGTFDSFGEALADFNDWLEGN